MRILQREAKAAVTASRKAGAALRKSFASPLSNSVQKAAFHSTHLPPLPGPLLRPPLASEKAVIVPGTVALAGRSSLCLDRKWGCLCRRQRGVGSLDRSRSPATAGDVCGTFKLQRVGLDRDGSHK